MAARVGYETPAVECGPATPARLTARAVVVALLAMACAGGLASAEGGGGRLSTTLVGSLVPGGEPRLAVRWDGEPGALLEVWVDLDGDERLTDQELVVRGRPLRPGIEVVGLEIPAEMYRVAEPELWVRAVEPEPTPAEQPAEQYDDGSSREGCAWQSGFFVADLDDPVYALAVYDDGSGPALYVGGSFATAGGVVVNHVARWDGTAWSALSGPWGTGIGGLYQTVYALMVYDDGSGPALYAGGDFLLVGGLPSSRIAAWWCSRPLFADGFESGDTSAWSAVVP